MLGLPFSFPTSYNLWSNNGNNIKSTTTFFWDYSLEYDECNVVVITFTLSVYHYKYYEVTWHDYTIVGYNSMSA